VSTTGLSDRESVRPAGCADRCGIGAQPSGDSSMPNKLECGGTTAGGDGARRGDCGGDSGDVDGGEGIGCVVSCIATGGADTGDGVVIRCVVTEGTAGGSSIVWESAGVTEGAVGGAASCTVAESASHIGTVASAHSSPASTGTSGGVSAANPISLSSLSRVVGPGAPAIAPCGAALATASLASISVAVRPVPKERDVA
jgi:hypothetical protein